MRNILRLIGLVSLSASAALANAQFVQPALASNLGFPYTSETASFGNSTTQGNLIVVYVTSATNNPGTFTVSDSANNAYIAAASTLQTGQSSCATSQEFFYATNIAGGADTITASTTAANGVGIAAMEYSGVATSAALDAQAGNPTSNCSWTTTPASASFTTSNANDLIVGGAIITATGPSWSAGSGFTLRYGSASTFFAAEDEAVSSAGSYSSTFNLSTQGTWIAAAVAFKASSGGGDSGAPTCGLSNDLSNYVPSDWTTFTPPAIHQSYVDPTFGCTVTRVTDASSEEWTPSCNSPTGCYSTMLLGYSTVSPFNANDTYLMLFDDWNDHFVTDLQGNIVVSIPNMPDTPTTNNDGWFYWDATNPNLFYYTNGNSMMSGTISGSTVTTATVHQFTEYSAINFLDKTDISQDGEHVVITGGNNTGNSSLNIFEYDFVTNTKGPVYTTGCTAVVSTNTNNNCVHGNTQTADDNVMIDFAPDGPNPENGNRLWTGQTPLPHIQDSTSHLDTGYDLTAQSIFISRGGSDILPNEVNACPSGWGIDVRPVANPTSDSAVCLLDDDIDQSYVVPYDAGYRGNAQQPWVVLSFFDNNRNPDPEYFDNDPRYTTPDATNEHWTLYKDEIVLVRIDANNNSQYIYRLARGYSRSDEDYDAQLHAAMSRDGKYIAFNSNMAYAHTGCPANFYEGSPNPNPPTLCSDVYVIKVK